MFLTFECNAKSFAIAIIFYFFFSSTANVDGLAIIVSIVFAIVTLGACEQLTWHSQ